MTTEDNAAAAETIERHYMRELQLESARRVLLVACALGVVAIIAWVTLAATDGGWIHGVSLAASCGAPLAAVILFGAATIAKHARR